MLCSYKYLVWSIGKPVVGCIFHGAQGGGGMLRKVERISCEGYRHQVVYMGILSEVEVEVRLRQ